VTTWLIDKSALVRLSSNQDASRWAERLDRGLLRIGTVTLLEVGFSARLAPSCAPRAGRCRCPPCLGSTSPPAAEDRAVEIQLLLADRGRHRAPSVPDLLLAAAPGLRAWSSCTWTRTSISSLRSRAKWWSG
jgi:predicted nucleic acid-binding protein